MFLFAISVRTPPQIYKISVRTPPQIHKNLTKLVKLLYNLCLCVYALTFDQFKAGYIFLYSYNIHLNIFRPIYIHIVMMC